MIDKLKPLFLPESVAVVGASYNPMKWGFGILHNLVKGKFPGKLYPVNPKGGEILGVKVYPSLEEIPGNIDLAMIALPKDKVFGAILECAKKGVKAVCIITAGFSEAGEKGEEEKIANLCREREIILVGPNGLGVMNNHANLHALMTAIYPPKGNISIIAQSGNLGDSFMAVGFTYNLGFSKFVSSGNEALYRTEDFLEYLGEDPQTALIMLYVEGIRDGRKFIEVAKKVTSKKPVVLLKGGVTKAGSKAAMSHTGALAGSEEVFRGVLKQCGIIQADNFQEMIDIVLALAYQPLPASEKIFVIAAGGGWGVITADACEKDGLKLVPLSPQLEARLKEILPPWWSPGNPIDMVAGRVEQNFERVLEALLESKEADSILTLGAGYIWEVGNMLKEALFYSESLEPVIQGMYKRALEVVDKVAKMREKYKKPIFVSSDTILFAHESDNQSIFKMIKEGFFVYPSPERATKVISKLVWYSKYLKRRGHPPPEPAGGAEAG